MANSEGPGKGWLRPFFFYGNNPISLIGGALTRASAMILIGFWVVDVVPAGGPPSPYVGIVIDLCLPGLFILGLILIPVGILLRRRRLKAAGQVPSDISRRSTSAIRSFAAASISSSSRLSSTLSS